MPIRQAVTRRRMLCSAGVVIAAAAGLGLYGSHFEPYWLEVVERPLPVERLPARLAGAKAVQLSDLHIGPDVDSTYLRQVFGLVESWRPDVVFYTGDFLNYNADVETHGRDLLSRLPLGSLGTFGVLGNHDYGPGWSNPRRADRVAELAGERGVRMLRNETADVAGLQVVGLEDLWGGRFSVRQAMSRFAPGRAAVALAHNPDAVDRFDWEGFSGWTLSGHTHGGQIKPPFLPPPFLPVQNQRYTSGEFALADGRRLYVNRGVGYLVRARLNARPEATVWTLTPAEA